MRSRAVFIAAAASFLLAACGGGGTADPGASEPSPPPTPPGSAATLTEGLYVGPSTTGLARQNRILVLEGGETWVYQGQAQPGDRPFFARGTAVLLSGSSTAGGVGATFGSATALVSNSPFSPLILGTGPMFFTSEPTPDGQSALLTLAGQPSLHLATVQDDGYDYHKPASLADVARSTDGVMRVDAAGAISSGPSVCFLAPECTYTGALTPRPTGKNVFDVTVTATGATCADAGTYSGVAYQTGILLNVLAINAEKTRLMTRQLDKYYMCF